MAEPRTDPSPPFQAGPARRAFHALIALGGWVLFAYWWWLVFRRVGRREVELTAFFIVCSLIIIVLVTVIWALHNARIHRQRGPRRAVRDVAADFSHDRVGREVRLPAVPEACRTAPLVKVVLRDGTKVYEAATAGRGPGGAAPRGTRS